MRTPAKFQMARDPGDWMSSIRGRACSLVRSEFRRPGVWRPLGQPRIWFWGKTENYYELILTERDIKWNGSQGYSSTYIDMFTWAVWWYILGFVMIHYPLYPLLLALPLSLSRSLYSWCVQDPEAGELSTGFGCPWVHLHNHWNENYSVWQSIHIVHTNRIRGQPASRTNQIRLWLPLQASASAFLHDDEAVANQHRAGH